MKHPQFAVVSQWLQRHPGIFQYREEAADLLLSENYSQKSLRIRASDLDRLEEKINAALPGETYLVMLFINGRQLVLSRQGFVFPPDLSNTGPIDLPSPVYCMQDFNNLFNRLRHLASEAERGREALGLIMVLIAILDGAKAVGLEVDAEAREVEKILSDLEKGHPTPPPH